MINNITKGTIDKLTIVNVIFFISVLLTIIFISLAILDKLGDNIQEECCNEIGGKIVLYECANCGLIDCSSLKCGQYCENDGFSLKLPREWDNCKIVNSLIKNEKAE